MSTVQTTSQAFPTLVFYEKPGCINNRKQKQILQDAGYSLDVKNLLTEPWQPLRLRAFFGDKPVIDWFNQSAPRVKSGEVNPAVLSEEEALSAMIAEPLLIRRPLIDCGQNQFLCGFDLDQIQRVTNTETGERIDVPDTIEQCPRSHAKQECNG